MSDTEKAVYLLGVVREIHDLVGYPVPDQLWRLQDCREHGWKWSQVNALCARAMREIGGAA